MGIGKVREVERLAQGYSASCEMGLKLKTGCLIQCLLLFPSLTFQYTGEVMTYQTYALISERVQTLLVQKMESLDSVWRILESRTAVDLEELVFWEMGRESGYPRESSKRPIFRKYIAVFRDCQVSHLAGAQF